MLEWNDELELTFTLSKATRSGDPTRYSRSYSLGTLQTKSPTWVASLTGFSAQVQKIEDQIAKIQVAHPGLEINLDNDFSSYRGHAVALSFTEVQNIIDQANDLFVRDQRPFNGYRLFFDKPGLYLGEGISLEVDEHEKRISIKPNH